LQIGLPYALLIKEALASLCFGRSELVSQVNQNLPKPKLPVNYAFGTVVFSAEYIKDGKMHTYVQVFFT